MSSAYILILILFLFDYEKCISCRNAYRALTVCGLHQRYSRSCYISGNSAQSAGQSAAEYICTSTLDGLPSRAGIRAVDSFRTVDIIGFIAQRKDPSAYLDVDELQFEAVGDLAGGHQVSVPRYRYTGYI